MDDFKKLSEYWVNFDENDSEKEFLIKCHKQFENILNSDDLNNLIIKMAHIATIFHAIDHRIKDLN
jgi:hypothetical protein